MRPFSEYIPINLSVISVGLLIGGRYTRKEVQVLCLLTPVLVFFKSKGAVFNIQIGKSNIFCS